MANTSFLLRLLCSLLFPFFSIESQASGLVPALYVFGDSLLDAGNNNYLNTTAKANYSPYGVDFPAGITGRFTNGHTFADFLAELLGLSIHPPPYLSLDSQKFKNLEGFNYASGSAGILPKTGRTEGENLNMKEQVKLFKRTVKDYLPLHIRGTKELSAHLFKSIFVVFIGSNDCINHFLQLNSYDTSLEFNPSQFIDLLINKLGHHLQDLYNLGARRFLVGEVGPIGCMPAMVTELKPKTICVDEMNNLALIFNKKLAFKMDKLRSKLKHSTIVVSNTYQLTFHLVKYPNSYGFNDSRNACCVVGNNGKTRGPCLPNTTPCKDRNKHVFWDSVHPSEGLNKLAATFCFNGTTNLCTPMNVLQLALKKTMKASPPSA